MTTNNFRPLAAGVLTLMATVAVAAAQDTPALLTSLEVQQHVSRAQPADHARLSHHFATLADRYETDARRYAALATAFIGNPNRTPAIDPAAHWRRLAERAAVSAITAWELAEYHQFLVDEILSVAPEDATRFEAGYGAPEPNTQQLHTFAALARTPTDHAVLEEYYLILARHYAADVEEHTAMAGAYRGNANRRGGDPAVHCDRMVKASRQAANDARAAAAEHRQWAGLR